MNNEGQDQELTLTEEEYNHVKSLRHNRNLTIEGNSECKANLEGNVSLQSKTSEPKWIIDSGATHHITYYEDLLAELRHLSYPGLDTVQLPTGNKAQIVGTGPLYWEIIC